VLIFAVNRKLPGFRQRRGPGRHRGRARRGHVVHPSNGGKPKGGQSYFPASIGRITTSARTPPTQSPPRPVPSPAWTPSRSALTPACGLPSRRWTALARSHHRRQAQRYTSSPSRPPTASPPVWAPPSHRLTPSPPAQGRYLVHRTGLERHRGHGTSGALVHKFALPIPGTSPAPSVSQKVPTKRCGSPRTPPTRSPASPPRGRSRCTPARCGRRS